MNLEIDRNLCISCKKCVEICPGHVLAMDPNNQYPYEKVPDDCINCGHCVAVCPSDAIIHKHMDMDNFPPVEDPNISFQQFYKLTRSRRSYRQYKSSPVREEDIKQLMNMVRYSPTGTNAQELKYIIINDHDKIKQIRRKIMKIMKFFKPFYHGFKHHVKAWQQGEDPALRTAPTLLVIYTSKKNSLTQWDAAIASTHIMLGAETLGIGTCWAGYHAIFSGLFRKIRKLSGVPKGHKVVGSLMMGYPRVSFQKVVDRNPVDYTII